MSGLAIVLAAVSSAALFFAAFTLLPALPWRVLAEALSSLGKKGPLASGLKGYRRSQALQLRRRACMQQLPSLIDVVALGLSAGLSFDAALALYCERFSNELAAACSEAALRWRIGLESREGALMQLARELDLRAMERFASAVGESLAFGSPLASVLERQAKLIRDERRAQVEEEIEKVPVKMLIPMGVLIVPAMLLSILGPLLSSAFSSV